MVSSSLRNGRSLTVRSHLHIGSGMGRGNTIYLSASCLGLFFWIPGYRLPIAIYEYLGERFGPKSQKTGAFFFFLSRILGASFRLYLVALVLHHFVLKSFGVPIEVTVVVSVALIYAYTFRGGIKTIVITDTLQTFFMLSALVLAIFLILDNLELSAGAFISSEVFDGYSRVFVFDDPMQKNYFFKSFIGGIFITIAMTGLDQDMMQKNLSCKNIKEAQLNMVVFSIILIMVTGLFVFLGSLLFHYSEVNGMNLPMSNGAVKTDLLFPEIALNQSLGLGIGITFFLGLIAAAYSSADGALTALTTSFCLDFLDLERYPKELQVKRRKQIHLAISVVLIVVIISFTYLLSDSVIDSLLTIAGYTYGPLLGLFAFGILTSYSIKEQWVALVSVISVATIALLGSLDARVLGGYQLGYELLPLNGLLTFIGLYFIRKSDAKTA
jgi:Na+/proline symporter